MKRTDSNRYATYNRCSTEEQARGAYSTIESQKQINANYVRSAGGLLVKEYIEERSGTSLKRPVLRKIIQDAEAGAFDVLVCKDSSRLARDNETHHVTIWLLRQAGVTVHFVEDMKAGNDLAGSIVKEMTILQNALYAKAISEKVTSKQSAMFDNGYFCGGVVPFGYTIESVYDHPQSPKKLIAGLDAHFVKQAFEILLAQKSQGSVLEYLQANTDRIWTKQKVIYLLRNQVYTGAYTHGEKSRQNNHTAIIDRQTWMKAQEVLDAIRETHTRPARAQDGYSFYLRGLVFCPHCNCNYTQGSAKSGKVHYYLCHKNSKRLSECPVGRVNAGQLHRAIIERIQYLSEHRSVMHAALAISGGWQKPAVDIKNELAQLNTKLSALNARVVKLTNLLADGRAADSLLEALERHETEKRNIQQQILEVQNEIRRQTVVRPQASVVQEAFKNILNIWEIASEEDRGVILSAVVSKVQVQQKRVVAVTLDPRPGFSAEKFALTRNKAASEFLDANYPPIVIPHLELKDKRRVA